MFFNVCEPKCVCPDRSRSCAHLISPWPPFELGSMREGAVMEIFGDVGDSTKQHHGTNLEMVGTQAQPFLEREEL